MSTYISSKKIISKVINLSLLLATTHFVIVNPVLADFEETIDREEKIPAVKSEDLSQDITEIQKIVEGTDAYKKSVHALEVVQNKIEDITHVDDIKSQRDEALRLLTIKRKSEEEFQEKVTQLEAALSQERTKRNDKKIKNSQLKTKVKELDNIVTSLNNQNKTLSIQNDQEKEEIEELKSNLENMKSEQEKTKSELKKTKLEEQQFREDVKRILTNVENKTEDLVIRERELEDRIEFYKTKLEEINNVIAEKDKKIEQLEQDQYNRLEQDRDFDDIRSYFKQQEVNQVKDELSKESATKFEKLTTEYQAEKKSLLTENDKNLADIAEKDKKIEQLEQDQYNRLEQDRDFDDIRSYFKQQEVNQVKDELSKESATKFEKLTTEYQAEKKSLLTENDKNLADIAEKDKKIEQLEQDQYNRLEQDRDFDDIRSYFKQQEVNQVKDELSKESATKFEKLTTEYQAEKKSLLTENDKNLADIAEKDKKIEQLEQDQYNRLEQDRDFDDIRSYFKQQEVNQVKDELSKESATKFEKLTTEYQAEKKSLEEQINNLRTENTILTQTDKSLADITQDLTRRLNSAEALSQKSAKDLVNTQSELTKITQENLSKELVIASLEKKLSDNKQELASALNVNGQSSDKIKALENDKSSLEARINLVSSEQSQNLLKIQDLEAKLLSEQEKHNNYTQQIAQLTKQNQIAKESLAKQILLQGQAIEITEDNERQESEILHQSRGLEANNNVQEVEILNQSRDFELNDISSITRQEITPQVVNGIKSMASVMTNSIEAASNQLYDNISSRFNWNDHISSGDERGQMEIWVKQGVGIVSQKPTGASGEGYKGRSHGLFIGIDHECELGDKNLIGAAIALNNKSKVQLRGSHAQLITDSNILSVYGKRYLNSQLAVSGAFSYFRATTEANNFGENIDKIKTHGTKFDLELSYNKLVSASQSWQPFIGVSYGTISAFDMNFKDQGVVVKMKKSRLLSGKIGTRVQLKQYNLENGINISPSLMASISKPLKIISGNRCVVNNSILSDENNSVLTHKIKDATLNLGGDLRINRNNIDIIASYNFSIRKKYQAHQGGIKLEVKL